jgi:hypothetical protein
MISAKPKSWSHAKSRLGFKRLFAYTILLGFGIRPDWRLFFDSPSLAVYSAFFSVKIM